MKFIYTLIAGLMLLGISVNASAQTTDSTKCYEYYKQLFTQKGTYELRDGIHEVIVTIRQGDSCGTVQGRVRIEGGKLIRPLYIRDETGNYVRPNKTLSDKYELYKLPLEFSIQNGMSKTTFITSDNDLVDIFLMDILKK